MAKQRWVLGCEYVGTEYHGWQAQPGLQTVQDTMQQALGFVANHEVLVYAAGRTDKGVHACNQVVHFDSDANRTSKQWFLGMNSYLPADIKCRWLKTASPDFHARFSAVARTYRYVIDTNDYQSVWHNHRAWWIPYPLDFLAMEAAAQLYLGEHDFSGFRGGDCQAKSPVKTILDIECARDGKAWVFQLTGNSFLHHMVRNLVGALVEIGRGRQDEQWLQSALLAKSRCPEVVMAPAGGLYFLNAHYDEACKIPLILE